MAVHTRFISLLAYPTDVYVHYWHTQVSCMHAIKAPSSVVHPRFISLLVYPKAVHARMKSLQAYLMAGYTNDITT